MGESPEQKELNLVGKVELRIALVESDSKLETILKTYLAPLLLKLASEHVKVRNKVISICQHVNTRIKPPTIQLPVAALLKQFKETPNSLVRHFDLLYIQEGIDRLPVQERLDLLPTLLVNFHNNYADSVKNAASLFHLFLKILHNLVLPVRGEKEDLALRSNLGLKDCPEDADLVALWLGRLILLTTGLYDSKRGPGLSGEDLDFLYLDGKKDIWVPSAGGLNLADTKVKAAGFLASGAFVDQERLLPALFASSDGNTRVSDIGDDILKRVVPAVSLDDPKILEKLFQVYLGARGPEGSLPARPPLQIKILGLLSKSKLTSSYIKESTQIIREGLLPLSDSDPLGRSGATKQGLESSKLRGQIFIFVNWLARSSSSAQIESFAPSLVHHLRTYIESQGWPTYNHEGNPSVGELESRKYGYESIGLLAAACPQRLLIDPDLDLLRWLFDSLSSDFSSREIALSIEQALSSVILAFRISPGSEMEAPLTNLLLYQMGLRVGETQGSGYKIVRSTQFMAARFSNRCLPFHNVKARWIDVLAINSNGASRNELIEEGTKGLDPYWFMKLNAGAEIKQNYGKKDGESCHSLPDFATIVSQFFRPERGGDTLSPKAHSVAAVFCRCLLIHQALALTGDAPVIDVEWERKLGTSVQSDPDARQKLSIYLGGMVNHAPDISGPLHMFLQSLFDGVTRHDEVHEERSAECLVELCSLSPDSALSSLAAKAASLENAIASSDVSLRLAASKIFGILASHPDSSQKLLAPVLKRFQHKFSTWSSAVGAQVLQIHGAILATAFFTSRLTTRGNPRQSFVGYNEPLLKVVFEVVQDCRDGLLVEGAIISVSELAAHGLISLEALPGSHPMSSLISKLKESATNGHEKAVVALGDLAMLCAEDGEQSMFNEIIAILYDLHEVRQPEIQFAVGSAFSTAVVGWASQALTGRLDIPASLPQMPRREKALLRVLNKVLQACSTTKPSLRQASCIWLLCLLQYCGQFQEIKGRLRDLQIAFKGFLADHDSLNRETAARGLTFVYEKGDQSIKDELVRDLVASFTGSNTGLAGTVSDQTQLFEPGALPTGDNQSITTYKDIMSLAGEVGDPSLVYRFMSMASNNAIWSSRSALGHFGLSKILSDSSVDGYLADHPKLYPVLFRYRFDPNSNVRASMNDIWKALVKDSANVIDKYFDSIMEDLLKNILGKEWRVRQACCAAIADLVGGRPLEKYEKYLERIWTLAYKVCDDIKGSVREAAQALARVLAGILTRSLEASDSSNRNINSMLSTVLPFLFSPSGLESSSKEIQVFSLKTLLDIIKSSNHRTLRPFVPVIVEQLISLLSSFEYEGINYLHLNAEKYGMTTQQIDDARLSGIKGSPLMEAIERCLDALDEATMTQLQTTLDKAIKSAVGLPSKVGASRVLVSLSTRHNFIFKPFSSYFLKLVEKQLLDRNDTVASAYASACGYLARLAADSEIVKLVAYCRKLYFDTNDDRHRVISGDTVHAVSKYASDRFKALAVEILPFVFVAKHDPNEQVRKLYKEAWDENVGGSRAVLLYLKEIVAVASSHLESQRWSIKHTSAFAIAESINSLGNEISEADARTLWPAIEKATSGKTWDGKSRILKALVTLAQNSKLVVKDAEIERQMQKIVIRESKRNNVVYRQEALISLGDFAELREDYDMYPQVLEVTEPVIAECLDDANEMDLDILPGGLSSKVVREATIANALSSLLRSINPRTRKDEGLSSALARVLQLTKAAMTKSGSSSVHEAIYEAEQGLFDKMVDVRMSNGLEETLIDYAESLGATQDQVERNRMKASEVMISLATLARKSDRVKAILNRQVSFAFKQERSAGIQVSLQRVHKLLNG